MPLRDAFRCCYTVDIATFASSIADIATPLAWRLLQAWYFARDRDFRRYAIWVIFAIISSAAYMIFFERHILAYAAEGFSETF